MKVISKIASGGFGRVERVELPDGRVVARKVFEPLAKMDDPEVDARHRDKLRQRFAHEVEAQRRLKDHGAIPVLDADLDADPPWYTMPLAEKSFRAQVDADREARTISIEPLADVLNALEEVHRLGYIHRDLKPENILFHGGKWHLADFGLVAVPSRGDGARLTSTGAAFASVNYCAPEQIIDFRNVDRTVDIYAFGCILHDIVGQRPRVPYQMQTAKGAVGAVISRCTQVAPGQRWKSIAALRSALLDAIRRTVSPSAPVDPNAPASAEIDIWRNDLASLHEWDSQKLDELVLFLEEGEANLLCADLDEERLFEIHGLDPLAFRRVALAYCVYAQGQFEFSYCDVVISRLLEIFELGEVDVKAQVVMAAAKLGVVHNRWSVMKKVIAMCGDGLDSSVAERLAIDIRATEWEEIFTKCARGISKPIDVFHKSIREALSATDATIDARQLPTRRERP